MNDEYIPFQRQADFYAPFPPCPPGFLQNIRPLLCALRIFKPGWYTLTLREMTVDKFFEYSSLQIQEVESVFAEHKEEPPSFFRALARGLEMGREIDHLKPRKFCVATEVNDEKWFTSLQPSERRRLEELIEQVNPEIKKKLSPALEVIAQALLQHAQDGLTSSISALTDTTESLMNSLPQ